MKNYREKLNKMIDKHEDLQSKESNLQQSIISMFNELTGHLRTKDLTEKLNSHDSYVSRYRLGKLNVKSKTALKILEKSVSLYEKGEL